MARSPIKTRARTNNKLRVYNSNKKNNRNNNAKNGRLNQADSLSQLTPSQSQNNEASVGRSTGDTSQASHSGYNGDSERRLTVGSDEGNQNIDVERYNNPEGFGLEIEAERNTEEVSTTINMHLGKSLDTKLLDIVPEEIGRLLGVSNSIQHFPNKKITKLARQVFTKVLRKTQEPNMSSEEEVTAFMKYFLLFVIICDKPEDNKDIARQMEERITAISNDDWDQFKLSTLRSKQLSKVAIVTDRMKLNLTSKYLKGGQISKAYSNLIETKVLMKPSGETLQKLKEKYPEQCNGGLSASEEEEMKNYVQKESDRLCISEDELCYLIRKLPNLIATGIDNGRNEHLRALIGYDVKDPSAAEFREVYAKHINRIINNDIPISIRHLFTDCEAVAIPKGDNEVRPIGKGSIDRKVASKAVSWLINKKIKHTFGKCKQKALDPKATESIAIRVSHVKDEEVEWDMFMPDSMNAFNMSSRKRALYEVMKSMPEIYPYLSLLYGDTSNMWYWGIEDGIEVIESKEGSQQGCNLGNLMCGLAFMPLTKKVSDIINGRGYSEFYVDDGNIACPFDVMKEVVSHILERGPDVGYVVHTLNKGIMMVAATGSLMVSIKRKLEYVRTGLSKDIIVLHPKDYAESATVIEDRSIYSEEELHEYDRERRRNILDVKREYGAKVLGSYVGDEEYVKKMLLKKIGELKVEAEVLVAHENVQEKLIFLTRCFTHKVNHLLRTMSPSLLEGFCKEVDMLQKSILCSILGNCNVHNLSEEEWDQATLSTINAGLGIRSARKVCDVAFLAATIDSGILDEVSNNTLLRDVKEAIDRLMLISNEELTVEIIKGMGKRSNDDDGGTKGRQFELNQLIEERYKQKFKDSIRDPKKLGWIQSQDKNKVGAAHWGVLPKDALSIFDSAAMRIIVNARLFRKQPLAYPGIRCDCKGKGAHKDSPIVDPQCLHCLSCAKEGLGGNIHNGVLSTVIAALRAAGCAVKKEPDSVFMSLDTTAFTEEQRRMRPDASIHNVDGEKIMIDVSVATPVPILVEEGVYTFEEAKVIFSRGNIRKEVKDKKYKDICNAIGARFQSIIFELPGTLHEDSHRFIKNIFKNFESEYMKGVLLKRYWWQRISCSFQQQFARGITVKMRKLNNSNGIGGNRYEYSNDFIQEGYSDEII